jgi:phosphoenolpyruvate synthase/pyruvate phosphate dikinase
VTTGKRALGDILWLGEPACHDRTVVGGKASNLSRLAADHQVPPGFCLAAPVFDRARAEGSERSALSPALRNELAVAYRELAGRCGVSAPGVAVRSSAVEEDGGSASFAGQHESYLNVVGPDAVAGVVLRCWESAYTSRAVEYRCRQGFALESVRLAVLVQQLVAADVSAVVFSANPVTGSREEVVIEAGWGLGESIVGGTVTPDTYVVRKEGLAVVSQTISEKTRMTVPVRGGTREVETPRFLRARPALDEVQTVEMVRLAMNLEREMGCPVDVECAYEDGRLYLLQCRPVTALDGLRDISTNPLKREENDNDDHDRTL